MNKHPLNDVYHAMADPTRRAVVERLARGPASVSELADPHDIALPTFLRHLGVLETAGLVESTKKGRVRTCKLTPDALEPARGWMTRQHRVWEARAE
ncbi:MAG: winged helix-turn-helix transcriptional regulator [Rhodobacteraceae bacterium]|nr:winged helix-turn-helix transcriptional regulator [Paracoccaceae bacterium]